MRDRIVRAAECIKHEILANNCKKLNIVLICVVSLMVAILRSADLSKKLRDVQCLQVYLLL
jgi:hypothetical protein